MIEHVGWRRVQTKMAGGWIWDGIQGKSGRDHCPFGFSMWIAGAGSKGGRMVGATDEIGLRAVEKPYHVRDLHATILDRVGLAQDALPYLHNGREERLTDIGGRVISELL